MRRRLGFWLTVLVSIPSAAAAPRVAIHPLVVRGDDSRAIEQSKADFLVEAGMQPIQQVSRAAVNGVVGSLNAGHGCTLEADGCLETLCRDVGAKYAMVAILDLDAADFVVQVKVVTGDGVVVRKLEEKLPKDVMSARAPQVRLAFKRVFAQLNLKALPEEPVKPEPVAAAKPAGPTVVAKADPVAAAPVEDSQGNYRTRLRVAQLSLGVLTLAAAGTATAFALMAKSEGASLRVTEGVLARADLQKAHGVEDKARIATALFVGAGVGAAISLAVILLAASDDTHHVSIAPVQGGAMVGVGGAF